ncbi:hypothetical protein DPMN_101935 [Dreissena polymorpha]|uniref:Uncharacterized protein n=1 Tax=Dreissena polymorpha TaxID=45954 RepID=A0A9D4LJY9_DREPO|nr:hypothetical protein DPMN_101935 [Dreissena polymorpha]
MTRAHGDHFEHVQSGRRSPAFLRRSVKDAIVVVAMDVKMIIDCKATNDYGVLTVTSLRPYGVYCDPTTTTAFLLRSYCDPKRRDDAQNAINQQDEGVTGKAKNSIFTEKVIGILATTIRNFQKHSLRSL